MILLVDDEPSLLRIMTIYLQRKGFHVAGAETVAQAAALMREHAQKIELALVDYSLGPQTGLDAIAALSCLKPRLKVILMSGMNVDPDEIRRYPNIVRSIRKPFRMDGLVAMVREMLSLPESPDL
jgi:two-component system response regulator GlrR